MPPHPTDAAGGADADDPAESALELYHESSKLTRADVGTFMRIGMINRDPGIRGVISLPFPGFARNRRIALPPLAPRDREFLEVIGGRRSARAFTGAAMDLGALANLLRIGNGITGVLDAGDGPRWPLRTTPSPGGLFPTRIFCAAFAVDGVPAGLYCFDPSAATLDQVRKDDGLRPALARITSMDDTLSGAACCVVLCCHLDRLRFKYGERSYRFALLEAGHVAQNLLLAAEYERLGAVVVGGFIDDELHALCSLAPGDEFAAYLVMVGALPAPGPPLAG